MIFILPPQVDFWKFLQNMFSLEVIVEDKTLDFGEIFRAEIYRKSKLRASALNGTFFWQIRIDLPDFDFT